MPTLVPSEYSFNITDMSSHDGRENYLRYYEIYDMFQNEKYTSDNEDIDEYKNICKSGIHIVTTHPYIFPYNEVARWCFTHLQKEIAVIVNALGVPIVSLKIEDIMILYKTPKPTFSLDESFLEKFRVDHKEFEALMVDWFIDK
jgi:hypothetical protein